MSHPLKPCRAEKSGPLKGTVTIPGDKSISHRALMLGACAVGETRITGLLESDDVINTARAMQALGATVTRQDDGVWKVNGVGIGGLCEPDTVLDMGNSGTGVRLLAGLVATHPITTFFTGDASLVKRPMGRVIMPLSQMGAVFTTRDKGRLPMAVQGAKLAMPVTYTPPMASAQVKSSVMLAALNTAGQTTVIEKVSTRDHTERMFRHFGVPVTVEKTTEGTVITVTGQVDLTPQPVTVPADPSSAAFLIAAALLVPDSHLTIPNVMLNPSRTGLLTTLQDMGAALTITNPRTENGEDLGDLEVRYNGPLTGVTVPPDRAASMIDEYPILSVIAACADGTTHMDGLEELRVKECDRLSAMANGLAACGVKLEEGADSLVIHGTGQAPAGGATIETFMDHRIAMSFLTLGLVSDAPITVDDTTHIATSFPTYLDMMTGLGAQMVLTGALCTESF